MRSYVKGLWITALMGLGLALAATPAGTAIQNQASASYVDSAGQPRTTTSNLVVTVVQQVYSLTLTPNGANEANPGQTRQGLPGSQVLFNYTLTNTGNGTDTFALSLNQGSSDNFDFQNVQIFLDSNCNGNLDAGETNPITSVTLGMGQSACLIVRGTIPTGANNGQYGNLNLVGTSQGNNAISDSDNWARAVVTTAAALTAFKSASPSGSVAPGGVIAYTVSGSNTGGSAAQGVSLTLDGNAVTGILIADLIPTGLTVNQMPTGNAGAGSVTFVYSTNYGTSSTTWSTLTNTKLPLTGNGQTAIGMLIQGSGAFFPQGAQYSFTFQAQVPSSAPAGTSYTNTAQVRFNNGSDQSVTTNAVSHTVGASYSVALGPYQAPTGNGSGSYAVGGYTVNRSGDTQTVNPAYDGTAVLFRHTLRNTGNTGDSFNLSLAGAPSGWNCAFFADDLTTPISGPVGPVAAGADYSFALRCTIPAGATNSSATSLTVTATSQNDPSKSDTTADTVSSVADGFRFDLYGGVNGNPPYTQSQSPGGVTNTSDDPATTRPNLYQSGTAFPSTNPGGQVVYRLRVKNLNPNGQADNYTLLVQPQSGYGAAVDSVLFYADPSDTGVPSGSPITTTGLIGAGQEFKYLAVVTLKPTAPPGPAGFNFAAKSTQSSAEPQDFAYSQVNVNTVAQVALSPNRSGTVTSPGTIQYTHTLTNASNAQATCSLSGNGGGNGWTYQYSLDGNTWQSSLTGVTVAANGGSQTVYVRVLVPAGQAIGVVDTNTLTASCTVGSATASASASETTTVVGGDLRLSKSAKSYVGSSTTVRSADGSQAYPGDQIEYTVVAENIGTANLTQVIVSDPLPAYTAFVSVSATATGFPSGATVLYSTDGTSWSTTAPASLGAGQSLYVGVDTNGDGKITGADLMPPGAKLTLVFKVQVQ